MIESLFPELQGNLKKSIRKLASAPKYISPNQLTFDGYETPFETKLYKDNRWIKLSKLIPWDNIVNVYDRQFKRENGRPPISGRAVIGAMIIKHICNFSDKETIKQIQENMYMQYLIGYTSFTNEEPFSSSLFVEIRERLDGRIIEQINDIVVGHALFEKSTSVEQEKKHDLKNDDNDLTTPHEDNIILSQKEEPKILKKIKNVDRLILDATVAPQNITFPTDLKLLHASRLKSEEIIDTLYNPLLHGIKPRTYREVASMEFKKVAKKKSNSNKEIYKSTGKQLRFLRRNLQHINTLLDKYDAIPLNKKEYKYLLVIQHVFIQQEQMHSSHTHSIENRIVNIHQPHVRPIVRGKAGKKVEFGSKIHVALVAGFALLDHLAWDAFNEGMFLKLSIEKYKERFGCYPKEVLADKIYCNRENRKYLKELGIKLMSKPLGRPSATAVEDHISPGARNPIEGKFGEAKEAYGMKNIKAKLQTTSQSWIALIVLVLNLAQLARLGKLWNQWMKREIKMILDTIERTYNNLKIQNVALSL